MAVIIIVWENYMEVTKGIKMSTLQRLFYDWKILMSLKTREREIGAGWFCRKMQRLHWSLSLHRERHFLRTSRLNFIFFLFPHSYFHSTFSHILCAVLFPASLTSVRGWASQPELVSVSFACMKLSSSEIIFSRCASVIFLCTDSSCPVCFGSLNLVLVCHPLGSGCVNGARWGNPESAPNPTVFNEGRLGTYRVNQREI